MSSIKPVFPSAIPNWVDKIDDVNDVEAIDVNTLAAEIISNDTTLGINPQVESNPPAGLPVKYSTVGSRITDANSNNLMPYTHVSTIQILVDNLSNAVLNTYTPIDDPFNMHNGVDLTIPANGWWIVSAEQNWDWWDDGYIHHWTALNGVSNILDEQLISYQFPGNAVIGGVPQRWQKYGKRGIKTKTMWQGSLHSGDRVSSYSENGTSSQILRAVKVTLKASMVRTIRGNFTSG